MKCLRMLLAAGLALMVSAPLWAANVALLLPLGRTAYETNELIDLSVVRSDAQALPASPLTILLTGEDGSKLTFTFDAAAVPAIGGNALATEHYHLNGWLLRPGKYTVQVTADGATAQQDIELFTHLRKTTFKLVHWSSGAQGNQHIGEGDDGMGFNLIYGNYRPGGNPIGNAETTLRGGADFMQVCTMSGAHQMDLRWICDWSDPYVTRGGTARVVQQAMANRTTPNCLGVHFYDEPGLTWYDGSPFDLPPQIRSYNSAFGVDPIKSTEVKPGDASAEARWQQFAHWKDSFMEAAWKEARAGVDKVNPNLISCTQSQYAWNAYTDGYYFNVARTLPVISGHGGYDDGAGGYLYPSYHVEFGRMRDLDKPDWYLPTWYQSSSDVFRLEQNMSFMVGLQGMATPPDYHAFDPQGKTESQGVVECNKMMGKLGTIFTQMPVTRGQVAVLYSLDQCIDAQIKSGMKDDYEGGYHSRAKLLQAYTAGKMIHTSLFPIVAEDVLDGTLAANHKAVLIAGINYLDPKVITALQGYIAAGGTVLISDDSQVVIPGATKLGAPCTTNNYDLLNKLWADGKQIESMTARNAGDFMKDAEPLAKALQAQFTKLGIQPDLDIDTPSVYASRHVSGDFEYLFALNATYDATKKPDHLASKAVTATIRVAADGRPVYELVHGGTASAFKAAGKTLAASYTFGPGQLRAFARTTRPIGSVQVQTLAIAKDYTVAQEPIHVNIVAQVLDKQGKVLFGVAPLQVRLLDPLGVPRYDLYRASQDGVLKMSLPLAVNDPAGKWTVEVKELLANTIGDATFTYTPPAQCGAAAVATQRAVFFGDDREKIFKFVRENLDVTIVKGTSDFNNAAADRIAASLKPWGVRCTIVNAADVNKPRTLSADEAKTWVGLEFGAADAGNKNTPYKVGFAVAGPVILLGNPGDNPLLAKVADWGFLPYSVNANFPGRGRGYLAWQYDAVGIGQESLAVMATDADGMSEAVGSLYEAAAGIDPLMPYAPPTSSVIAPAVKDTRSPGLTTAWQLTLPDRPLWMNIAGGQISVATDDGQLSVVDAAGKLVSQKSSTVQAPKEDATPVPAALTKQLLVGRSVKQVITSAGATAINYWGGTVQVFGADNALKAQQQLPQDIVTLGWNGNGLIAALADGTLVSLK